MNCEQVNEWLFTYIDGECPAWTQEAVRAHLMHCAVCRRLVVQTQHLEAELRDNYIRTSTPPDLWKRIATTIAAREVTDGRVARLHRLLRCRPAYRLATAAAVTVLLCLSLWWGLSYTMTVPLVVEPVNDFVSYQRQGGRLADFETALARVGRGQQEKAAVIASLPRFEAAGYQLVGSRLCTFLGRQLTALLYRKGEKRLSLYIMPASGLTLPSSHWRIIAQRRVAVHRIKNHTNLIWQQGGLIFSMVSELPISDMTQLL